MSHFATALGTRKHDSHAHVDHSWWSDQTADRNRITGVLHIPLCYHELVVEPIHGKVVQEAINVWHTALGCYSGIKFKMPIPNTLCSDPLKQVHLMMHPDVNEATARASLATQGDGGLPRWTILLPAPSFFEGRNPGEYNYVDMLVHELGKYS